jgi:ABC-type nitrate/sulfonate/bicarbonate transport system permease component
MAGRADWWLEEGRSERWLVADRALITMGILLLWQIAVAVGVLNERFIPAPTKVVGAMWELAQLPEIRSALLQAMWMVAVAFSLAAVLGILLGAAIGLSNLLYRVMNPVVMMLFSTPKLIFLPLFVVVFGVQFNAKVAYGVTSGVFPIIVTVIAGVRAVEKRLLISAESMGASRWQTISMVLIPGSLPSVFVGLWHGIKHSLLGVLIMELFASQRGVGFFIRSYTSGFKPERVFALIFFITIFAIAIGQLVRFAELRVSHRRKTEV